MYAHIVNCIILWRSIIDRIFSMSIRSLNIGKSSEEFTKQPLILSASENCMFHNKTCANFVKPSTMVVIVVKSFSHSMKVLTLLYIRSNASYVIGNAYHEL